MANIHCNYYSDALKLNTDINVVIPTPNSDELMNNKDTSYWHPVRSIRCSICCTAPMATIPTGAI